MDVDGTIEAERNDHFKRLTEAEAERKRKRGGRIEDRHRGKD